MGRYYSGDINGKFGNWQDADAADRFGFEGQQPNSLEYYYDKDNFDVDELKSIINKLNMGTDYIYGFIEGDTYSITGHQYYNNVYKTEGLKNGIKLEDIEVSELVDKIDNLYCIFYCFEDNKRRNYESSAYGMKVDEISNEATDKIVDYVTNNNLVKEFEDAYLGAQIYACIQKNEVCNFSSIY